MRALVAIFVIALAHTQHASAQVETTIPTICPSQCVATLSPLVKKVAPSVVNIAIKGRVAKEQNPLFNGPFFRRFFNLPELPAEREIRAASSGVIVDPSHGLVITTITWWGTRMKSRSRLVMGRRLPLLGITYDSKDDLLEIALEGLDHLINKPLAISVDDDPEGLIGMEIVDSEGRRHILKLTDPLRRPANSKADSIRREAAMNKMNAIL